MNRMERAGGPPTARAVPGGRAGPGHGRPERGAYGNGRKSRDAGPGRIGSGRIGSGRA